mgnify:CR=1 FL=1
MFEHMFDTEKRGRLSPAAVTAPAGVFIAGYLSTLEDSHLDGYDRITMLRAHQRLASHYQALVYRDMVEVYKAIAVEEDEDDPELAIEAAAGCPRVYAGKRPVCWLTGFGDSSVDFVLRFWINDPREGLTNIRGKVLLAVWDTFQEHGINIPFPHREVIMKTPVEVSSKA